MSSSLANDPTANRMSRPGDPPWEIALLYPRQGNWTESDYLELSTNHLVEFSDGCVEVLPMPTKLHQRIVRFLFLLFNQFVSARGLGEVLFAPLPVRLWPGKFRDPDIVYLRPERGEYCGQPEGADLVVEVVTEVLQNVFWPYENWGKWVKSHENRMAHAVRSGARDAKQGGRLPGRRQPAGHANHGGLPDARDRGMADGRAAGHGAIWERL